MNRHLNAFVPYERPGHHEDQLTRAAMIIVRAIPLARDVLLSRLNAPPSGRLPEPSFGMQTMHVAEPVSSDGEASSIHQLISVFLTPDDQLRLSKTSVAERESEQRLDGVLQFGDELVIVIESKVVADAPSSQVTELRLRGIEFQNIDVAALGWHELLEDWFALLERELLAPAERVLMEDLVAYTEELFPSLLPFTTLASAGEHKLRVERRLMALIRDATGIDEVVSAGSSETGAIVMTDSALGSISTQRLALKFENGHLVLSTWPAELKPQAKAFYLTDRGLNLVRFASERADENWIVHPNIHLGYRGARTRAQRLYTTYTMDLAEYVDGWSGEDFSKVGAHRHDTVETELWPWLKEKGYASTDDDDGLIEFLSGMGKRDAHLRPGVYVKREWPWAEALALDERGELTRQIGRSIRDLLEALEEPPLHSIGAV